jgi:hypothetical protein
MSLGNGPWVCLRIVFGPPRAVFRRFPEAYRTSLRRARSARRSHVRYASENFKKRPAGIQTRGEYRPTVHFPSTPCFVTRGFCTRPHTYTTTPRVRGRLGEGFRKLSGACGATVGTPPIIGTPTETNTAPKTAAAPAATVAEHIFGGCRTQHRTHARHGHGHGTRSTTSRPGGTINDSFPEPSHELQTQPTNQDCTTINAGRGGRIHCFTMASKN